MAYCRWSSMDWRCDIYCYEHVDGGYAIHVAGRRRANIDQCPKVNWDLLSNEEGGDLDEWQRQYDVQMKWLEDNREDFVPIDLPYSGETFYPATVEDCVEKLRELRHLGYIMPDNIEGIILIDAICETPG